MDKRPMPQDFSTGNAYPSKVLFYPFADNTIHKHFHASSPTFSQLEYNAPSIIGTLERRALWEKLGILKPVVATKVFR
jgi:hypothetical protein